MVSNNTLQHVRQFCKPGLDAGLIPRNEFNELLKTARNDSGNAADDDNRLLKTREAARLLTCHEKTVLRLAGRGVLPKVYIERDNPKSLRFRLSDVQAIITGQGVQ